MIEVLTLLLVSVSIHFLVLVFHNKQKLSSQTFFKASLRILGFGSGLLIILYLLKPLINNVYDEIVIVLITGFLVFLSFYLKDYHDEKKRQ
jgi:uncharacterized membrane protein YccC